MKQVIWPDFLCQIPRQFVLSLTAAHFSSRKLRYKAISEPIRVTNCRAAIGRIFKGVFSY